MELKIVKEPVPCKFFNQEKGACAVEMRDYVTYANVKAKGNLPSYRQCCWHINGGQCDLAEKAGALKE